MRIEHKPEAPWPPAGDGRIESRYLWWPKRIGDETRWLEWATWEEEVVHWVDAVTLRDTRWSWEATRWVKNSDIE